MNKSNSAISYEMVKTSYLETLNSLYTLNLDLCISNSDPHRSIIAQSFLFDKTEDNILMFSRGFKSNIFSHRDVINSFSNMVKRVIENRKKSKETELSTKEAIIKILVKENEEKFNESLNHSGFGKLVKSLEKETSTSILSTIFVNPYDEITPKKLLQVDDQNETITIKENSDVLLFSQLSSFQIFDNKHLRVRRAPEPGHKSDALINLGKSPEFLQEIEMIFQNLIPQNKSF